METTGIYREDNMELLYVLYGQEGSVTHVQFSKDGNYLSAGGHKEPYILYWDIRKSVDIVYKATEITNQHVFFDIEPCVRHLGTGGQILFIFLSLLMSKLILFMRMMKHLFDNGMTKRPTSLTPRASTSVIAHVYILTFSMWFPNKGRLIRLPKLMYGVGLQSQKRTCTCEISPFYLQINGQILY